MRHPLLSQIPDDLLRRTTGPAEAARTRRLHAWLEYRNYRPLLADLEGERARRGHRTTGAPRAGHREEHT